MISREDLDMSARPPFRRSARLGQNLLIVLFFLFLLALLLLIADWPGALIILHRNDTRFIAKSLHRLLSS